MYCLPHLSYPSWFNHKKSSGIKSVLMSQCVLGWCRHLASHCEKTFWPSIHTFCFAFTQVDNNCQWQLVLYIGWANALNHLIYKTSSSWQLLSMCVLSSSQRDVPQKKKAFSTLLFNTVAVIVNFCVIWLRPTCRNTCGFFIVECYIFHKQQWTHSSKAYVKPADM